MRRMRITPVLALAFLLTATADCGALRRKPGAGSYSDHKIEAGGLTREYIRYAPAGEAPRYVLILLHGGGGKPKGMIRLAHDMPALADKHGILLLYPEGLGGHWNDGRGDISEAAKKNVDDIAFLRALIAEAGYPQKIDRVFVAGMSNGGMMAQRVGCDMADVVAGVVTVGANLPAELEKKCSPARPLSVTFIAGMEDPIVPYNGGAIKVLRNERGIVLSIENSLAFWSKRLNCTAGADREMTASAIERDYICAAGAVKLIAVKNGGHAWPGGTPYLPGFMIGKTSEEFSTSEKIVALLKTRL